MRKSVNFDSCRALLLVSLCSAQLLACSGDKASFGAADIKPAPTAWWLLLQPVVIDGDEYYGKPCSVTRVRGAAGANSAEEIFEVPNRLMTYCAAPKPGKNYLEYDGEFVVLHVDRQTLGAGSWTGERYRSADLEIWEQYIGVSWVDGEEYEAWRKLGSTSSKADSRTKVVRE